MSSLETLIEILESAVQILESAVQPKTKWLDSNLVLPVKKSILLYNILQEWIDSKTEGGICKCCGAGLINEELHKDSCPVIYTQEIQKAIDRPEHRSEYFFKQPPKLGRTKHRVRMGESSA